MEVILVKLLIIFLSDLLLFFFSSTSFKYLLVGLDNTNILVAETNWLDSIALKTSKESRVLLSSRRNPLKKTLIIIFSVLFPQ